jgi:glycosyltransferase involved in cell wall biosynthesis
VEQLVAKLGDRVVVAGGAPHDVLAAYYALADVYTMPSTGPEPFSLTVPEAMGCGLPVVATAYGGTTEIVESGENGLLVPPGDIEALAAALVQLCRDPDLARELGARGRTRVVQDFAWQTQGARLISYYDDLVRAGP